MQTTTLGRGPMLGPTIFLLAVLMVAQGSRVSAEALPTFPKSMSYLAARQSLIRQGWEPLRLPDAFCHQGDERCQGISEVSSCGVGALAACTFTWKRGDIIINVITHGERANPGVAGVQCRSGCTAEPVSRAAATPPKTIGAPTPSAKSEPQLLEGIVATVVDAAHLVIAGQKVRLIGIDPGPSDALAPFEKWLRTHATLKCEPSPRTSRYRCVTTNGVDVAEAALLNGAAQVGDDAAPVYREREAEARQARRGLWAKQ